MTIPFSEIKALHREGINMLLEEDGCCSVPCRVIYEGTKFTTCSNCIFDVIGGKSSNRYKTGGPVQFWQGTCPVCNGVGKISVTETDTIYALPIWNSKDWILSNPKINVANIMVQTMSKINTYPQLKRTSAIVIDTAIELYGVPEFVRIGDPSPLGLGESSYVITSWGRA